jgi:hypothetical protein
MEVALPAGRRPSAEALHAGGSPLIEGRCLYLPARTLAAPKPSRSTMHPAPAG